ncbi:MAG: FAD-binding oxidoreductase [Paracoccaceae bacterium]
MNLSGWGQFPTLDATVLHPRTEADVARTIAQGPLIARGMGRAYGDAAIARRTLSMRHFNRMIAFDGDTGQLIAESGVTLGEIIDALLPRGWFPAVTPGTKYVSLGGAIAADVHGKNHHKDGSFGSFVDWIDVMGPEGTVTRAMAGDDLFHWTLGGMGLTGIILRAAIRLRRVESGWIHQNLHIAGNLSEAIDIFEDTAAATYSVGWIDTVTGGAQMGRSLIMTGEHSTRAQLPLDKRARPLAVPRRKGPGVPFNFPAFALNPLSVRLFNMAYYNANIRRPMAGLVDWDSYFYPLDSIDSWNRIYGARGFMQFQCALPLESSRAGLDALLKAISDSGASSFLSVLKRFGAQDSRLSFPTEGYTLALDFPRSQRAIALMPLLDKITADHGGRFYLAKDSRVRAGTFHQTDPRWTSFAAMRRETGLARAFASAQSERLSL